MTAKGNIFVTNNPRPANKIHSSLKLGLTPVSSDSKVRRDSRRLNCHLDTSSFSKGVLDCRHHLAAISTLRAKTWRNQKPVCHMSTSLELITLSIRYYKHWAPPEPKKWPNSSALQSSTRFGDSYAECRAVLGSGSLGLLF